MLKRLRNTERGFTFIEVLIALVIIGLFFGGLFMVLAGSARHTFNADIRASAESIARTQMEHVKNLEYDGTNNPPVYTAAALPVGQGNWSITITAVRLDPKGDGTTTDDGLQKIIVTVYFGGNQVLSLQGYKIS